MRTIKGGGETNSVWLTTHTGSAGNIVFKIKPVNPADYYNFAVLNISGRSCSSLSMSEIIRCNFNSNVPVNIVNSVVGLTDTSPTAFIEEGTYGRFFGEIVFAKSDEVYLIMINNYGNDGNGSAILSLPLTLQPQRQYLIIRQDQN